MAILSRAQILAAVVVPTEVVRVPELGGEIIVCGMTAAERDSWEASLFTGKGKHRQFNADNIRAKLVAKCVVDENGNRLFSEQDVATLGRVRVDVMARLHTVAQRLSGITDADEEDAVDHTLTSDAPSTSA